MRADEASLATPGRETVRCFDLIIPGVGELIGGSEREERYEQLLSVARDTTTQAAAFNFDSVSIALCLVACHMLTLALARVLLHFALLQHTRLVLPAPTCFTTSSTPSSTAGTWICARLERCHMRQYWIYFFASFGAECAQARTETLARQSSNADFVASSLFSDVCHFPSAASVLASSVCFVMSPAWETFATSFPCRERQDRQEDSSEARIGSERWQKLARPALAFQSPSRIILFASHIVHLYISSQNQEVSNLMISCNIVEQEGKL